MEVLLKDGTQIQIKNISLSGNYIDYRRVNQGYNGDCILYLDTTVLQEAVRTALQTVIGSNIKIELEAKALVNMTK